MTGSRPRIHLAAHHGSVGGGEVMLLHVAHALRDLGIDVSVLAPRAESGVLDHALAEGFDIVDLGDKGRPTAMLRLAEWRRRHPDAALWCHGLAPALATAGSPGRIVHLHQIPRGAQRAAISVARLGARAVLMPSSRATSEVPGARELANWTEEIALSSRAARPTRSSPARIGFLGRFTRAKGLDVLAHAVRDVRARGDVPVQLVLAGESRFAAPEDRDHLRAALAPLDGITEHLGWVDPASFFAEVDLAVFPSVQEESFGLVVAEAMAAGVPFIISDAGALPEVAGPDHPWVVPRGDASALADMIVRVLMEDPDIVRTRRSLSRSRWQENFSPRSGTRRTAELLESLPLVRSPGDRRES